MARDITFRMVVVVVGMVTCAYAFTDLSLTRVAVLGVIGSGLAEGIRYAFKRWRAERTRREGRA